jgi:hypothetical protein
MRSLKQSKRLHSMQDWVHHALVDFKYRNSIHKTNPFFTYTKRRVNL